MWRMEPKPLQLSDFIARVSPSRRCSGDPAALSGPIQNEIECARDIHDGDRVGTLDQVLTGSASQLERASKLIEERLGMSSLTALDAGSHGDSGDHANQLA
jgi:hypothetical protein